MDMEEFIAWWSGDSHRSNTFRPRRGHKPGTRQFFLHKHAERTLGSGNCTNIIITAIYRCTAPAASAASPSNSAAFAVPAPATL